MAEINIEKMAQIVAQKAIQELRDDGVFVGKWIPVSEGLPEDGDYLVTVERINDEPWIDMRSFAKDLNKVDEFTFPKRKCGWYDYDSTYGYWEDTDVIAWMPLPEPYKAESEVSNESRDNRCLNNPDSVCGDHSGDNADRPSDLQDRGEIQ